MIEPTYLTCQRGVKTECILHMHQWYTKPALLQVRNIHNLARCGITSLLPNRGKCWYDASSK